MIQRVPARSQALYSAVWIMGEFVKLYYLPSQLPESRT